MMHSDEQWAFHTECGICEVQAEAEGAVEYWADNIEYVHVSIKRIL